jgi:hypothetical protein
MPDRVVTPLRGLLTSGRCEGPIVRWYYGSLFHGTIEIDAHRRGSDLVERAGRRSTTSPSQRAFKTDALLKGFEGPLRTCVRVKAV